MTLMSLVAFMNDNSIQLKDLFFITVTGEELIRECELGGAVQIVIQFHSKLIKPVNCNDQNPWKLFNLKFDLHLTILLALITLYLVLLVQFLHLEVLIKALNKVDLWFLLLKIWNHLQTYIHKIFYFRS
jgi:hypothetical protein